MRYIRKYWHIIAGVICVVILGIVYLPTGNRSNTPERIPLTTNVSGIEASASVVYTTNLPSATEQQQIQQPAQIDIVVHIEGAVKQPGVFTLPYGSRVNDVLNLAGGPTEEADLARINLAAFLQDAVQIIIPTIGEEIATSTANYLQTGTNVAADTVNNSLVNINTADERILTTLPGVGPVIAGNIIAHREANGSFSSVEELRNVPRIGEVTMDRLRNLVTIN